MLSKIENIPAPTGLSKEVIQQAVIKKCGRQYAREHKGILQAYSRDT